MWGMFQYSATKCPSTKTYQYLYILSGSLSLTRAIVYSNKVLHFYSFSHHGGNFSVPYKSVTLYPGTCRISTIFWLLTFLSCLISLLFSVWDPCLSTSLSGYWQPQIYNCYVLSGTFSCWLLLL